MSAVVDASVIVRALLPGQAYHAEARMWLEQQDELLAPRLLWYEVTTALRRLEYANVLDPATTDIVLQAALSLRIKMTAAKHLHAQALAIARALGVSRAHDAAYLAVAVEHGVPLATLDERLVRNGRSHGYPLIHPAEVVRSAAR
ncbi:type II toxin-antitoxin system VapC family toxin [Limnochorda pilosa]|uniref:Ribonuclease VapC n=1 Tax=Limnochorda pilosa TaxID=1555112 RepID=A0A0K2SN67_LIMPI|nr:type II toxin-antitoxin system VapC family toxin [Limnochorda pilosa]BAS28556.1 hypothetical protein LIP_2726 [Limnochorda pilosa]